MKKTLGTILVLLLSQCIFSQICEEISPYKEGLKLEYTQYNKKGKVKSIENHRVTSVENSDGSLSINLQSTTGKKSKETKNYTLNCVDGDFYIDMSNYTSLQEQSNGESVQVKASGSFLEFPATMNEGDNLRDGNIDIAIGDGDSFGNLATMKVLNRKVLKIGSIDVKAGTFDGYKIAYDYVFNLGIIKIRGSGIEWYVKGIGIVKSENYSKKGKLKSSNELTKIEGH